jgi:ABC-type multidrug transport system fused ATPase/permease subunit
MLFYKNVPLLKQGRKVGGKIFKEMFGAMMKAPIAGFFDKVPSGKLIHRYIHCLSWLSSGVLHFFSWILTTIFDYLELFIIQAFFLSPWLIPIQLIGWYFVYKQRTKIQKVRHMVRSVNSGNDGPTLSLFSETLNGLATMRVYNNEDRIMKEYVKLRDVQNKYAILPEVLEAYHDISMEKITCAMLIPQLLISLLSRNPADITAGFLGVLFTYCNDTEQCIQQVLCSTHEFEESLLDFERCH